MRDDRPAPKLFSNQFAGLQPGDGTCDCDLVDEPGYEHVELGFHDDAQDRDGEAWRTLLALIDAAAADGRETFSPGADMPRELWLQIVTLPREISRLKQVRQLNLYGSNISVIPPEIGDMQALESFTPYTSRRLHWFPYEITRCRDLRGSTVSTRHLYGNFKNRLPFPKLPAAPPGGSPTSCSVCAGPLASPIQAWISLPVATDVLPLLVHACSQRCIDALPRPPKGYVGRPHQGGRGLVQPPGY
jgi:hypothetical protein